MLYKHASTTQSNLALTNVSYIMTMVYYIN